VERIVDHKKVRGINKYLIKWKGFGNHENVWRTERQLHHSPELLKGYWQRRNAEVSKPTSDARKARETRKAERNHDVAKVPNDVQPPDARTSTDAGARGETRNAGNDARDANNDTRNAENDTRDATTRINDQERVVLDRALPTADQHDMPRKRGRPRKDQKRSAQAMTKTIEPREAPRRSSRTRHGKGS
jgi:Chromo (CHRromatin Organisation MOdifier) domain